MESQPCIKSRFTSYTNIKEFRTASNTRRVQPFTFSRIKNERYVEFYAEGQRYFDVRRWVEGGKYLAAGKREGLRAEEKGLEYDEFRQRIKVNQPYEWNNRQYILPIYYVDVNSNPQLVQAPGYGN